MTSSWSGHHHTPSSPISPNKQVSSPPTAITVVQITSRPVVTTTNAANPPATKNVSSPPPTWPQSNPQRIFFRFFVFFFLCCVNVARGGAALGGGWACGASLQQFAMGSARSRCVYGREPAHPKSPRREMQAPLGRACTVRFWQHGGGAFVCRPSRRNRLGAGDPETRSTHARGDFADGRIRQLVAFLTLGAGYGGHRLQTPVQRPGLADDARPRPWANLAERGSDDLLQPARNKRVLSTWRPPQICCGRHHFWYRQAFVLYSPATAMPRDSACSAVSLGSTWTPTRYSSRLRDSTYCART